MSIISDALKKVEGNSTVPPRGQGKAPRVELVDGFARVAKPPLFSVWSIFLSTLMVLIAAVLLLVTWYTNRPARPEPAPVPTPSVASVADVAATPAPAVKPEARPAPRPAEPAGTDLSSAVAAKPETAPGDTAAPGEPPAAPVEPPAAEITAAAPVAPAGSDEAPVPEPKAAAATRGDDLVLTGVVYTPRIRMAHINGEILPEGAEIKGYRIVTVSRETVRLSKDDKFYILRLKR